MEEACLRYSVKAFEWGKPFSALPELERFNSRKWEKGQSKSRMKDKLRESENETALIRMFHVYKRYGTKHALIDISLDISKKEFLFVSGPSGAGKSTLLKLLYLGESASEGQIIVDGISLSRISLKRIPYLRRKFGIIFQDFRLIPNKTVFDNVAIVCGALGMKRGQIKKKVSSVLRTVGMEKRHKTFPERLSGGEQQRVAIARAVAGDPQIILADEPTASLDADSARIVLDLLKGFNKLGTTVMIATHDTELIRKTGGRVVLLDSGRLEISTVIPKLDA